MVGKIDVNVAVCRKKDLFRGWRHSRKEEGKTKCREAKKDTKRKS